MMPEASAPEAAAARSTAAVAAAIELLGMLSPVQRRGLLFPLGPPIPERVVVRGGPEGRLGFVGERCGEAVWTNFPVSDIPRLGLALGAMDAAQREATRHLLATLLSPGGYRTVEDVMGSDQALAERRPPYACGRAHYTIGLFGTPGPASPWMVQFGGHHLGLNIVLDGPRAVLAPAMTGAQPSRYTLGGGTVRVLAAENDAAFALLATLDPDQRAAAVLGPAAPNLRLGPGSSAGPGPIEGLFGAAMDASQRSLMLDLAAGWVGLLNPDHAAPRIAAVAADLPRTAFQWRGPTTREAGRNGAGYVRLHGPTLSIEFAPQRTGGDPTEHVHTVYRDLANDYGRLWRHPSPANQGPMP